MPTANTAVGIHRPERSHVELVNPADAEEFLEVAFGIKLRLSARGSAPNRRTPSLIHTRSDVGPFFIDVIHHRGDFELSPDPVEKVIGVWATDGRIASHCDGKIGHAARGEITLVSQHDLPNRAHVEDLHQVLLVMEPSLVAGVATGLPAQRAPLPVHFSSFAPVDTAARRLWQHTVSYVKDAVLADDVLATPLVLGHASRLLAAATLATFPNTATTDPKPHDRTDHHPVLLRRATDFIDSNASRDIALPDIAEAAHLTSRAVQYMFRRHLDTTPMQYLRRCRLRCAHHDLVAADRMNETVTAIAARWGFMHTGRFAALYRQTYGQSPRTVLRGGD